MQKCPSLLVSLSSLLALSTWPAGNSMPGAFSGDKTHHCKQQPHCVTLQGKLQPCLTNCTACSPDNCCCYMYTCIHMHSCASPPQRAGAAHMQASPKCMLLRQVHEQHACREGHALAVAHLQHIQSTTSTVNACTITSIPQHLQPNTHAGMLAGC